MWPHILYRLTDTILRTVVEVYARSASVSYNFLTTTKKKKKNRREMMHGPLLCCDCLQILWPELCRDCLARCMNFVSLLSSFEYRLTDV